MLPEDYKKLPKHIKKMSEEMVMEYTKKYNLMAFNSLTETIRKETNPFMLHSLLLSVHSLLMTVENQIEAIKELQEYETRTYQRLFDDRNE